MMVSGWDCQRNSATSADVPLGMGRMPPPVKAATAATRLGGGPARRAS